MRNTDNVEHYITISFLSDFSKQNKMLEIQSRFAFLRIWSNINILFKNLKEIGFSFEMILHKDLKLCMLSTQISNHQIIDMYSL